MTYNISEFAEQIGVCTKTLRRWDNSGRFRAYRTPANHRYYTEHHLKAYIQMTQKPILPEQDNAKRA